MQLPTVSPCWDVKPFAAVCKPVTPEVLLCCAVLQLELEQQIAEREAARRASKAAAAAKEAAEAAARAAAPPPWDPAARLARRGGGGEPLKGMDGVPVTDLRSQRHM